MEDPRRRPCSAAESGLSWRHHCFTFTSTSSTGRCAARPGDPRPTDARARPDKERNDDVRAEQGARGLPEGRRGVRARRGRAAHRAVGPRAPLPRRPGAQDGRARPLRPRRAGGVRRHGGRRRFTSLCVAIEELGRVDQSIGITLSAGVGLGINPILTYGSDEQKQRFLPDLVAGRALAGFGLTEPDAGSDAGATRTKAVRDGDEWVINGAKAFITNSGTDITSVVTVTARTPAPTRTAPPRSAPSWSRTARRASPSSRPTTSSAGTPPTPTA